jgi:hypothetical protein
LKVAGGAAADGTTDQFLGVFNRMKGSDGLP